jgi:hypothetical protein
MGRVKRLARSFAVLGVMALSAANLFPAPAHATALPPGTALVYGDSLTYESRFQLTTEFAKKKGWTLKTHTFGGTTPCDWLSWLPSDLAAYHPSVVTLLTAGNAGANACMGTTVIGSPDFYAKYTADLEAFFAMATASGAKVVYFTPPPFADPARQAAAKQLTKIATALAFKYHGVSIANGVKSALGGNTYTAYKPCLASETATMGCIGGLIPIRTVPPAPDAGLHLCPPGLVAGTQGTCAVYSSGELRLARSMTTQTVAPPAPKLP